ncbi:MAG: ribose-5-phosphate isomerase RpiA [Parvularculaceae bacterium]|nr:ribose-5-phosphate isomerase RpiA [Parvularculaceae bacterium]
MGANEDSKRKAAEAALALVEDGMTLGLGTGSTAAFFVKGLAGKRVKGVATSEETRRIAESVGVAVIEADESTRIDLAVDGADEIDLRGDLIKGGGGALLREKIVASAAARFVVIADQSKAVAELGAFPLPVEIDRFAWGLAVRRIRAACSGCGLKGALTLRFRDGAPFLTDGGNYVIDCALGRIHDPAALDLALRAIPGVVTTGLFIGLADLAFVAGPGGVRTLSFERKPS